MRHFIPFLAPSSVRSQQRQNFLRKTREFLTTQYDSQDLITQSCKLEITFHFPYSCNRDIDNMLKATLDGLKGILIKDDCLIKEIHAFLKESSIKAGIEIELNII